jgi:hypothetical protein
MISSSEVPFRSVRAYDGLSSIRMAYDSAGRNREFENK